MSKSLNLAHECLNGAHMTCSDGHMTIVQMGLSDWSKDVVVRGTTLDNETVENACFTPNHTPYQNLTPPVLLADPENGFWGE